MSYDPDVYHKSNRKFAKAARLAVSALTLNEREALACLMSDTRRPTCSMKGKAWVRFWQSDKDILREIWCELCGGELECGSRKHGVGRAYDYDEIMRLHGQGVSGAEIARRIGASSRFVVNNIIRKCKEEEE